MKTKKQAAEIVERLEKEYPVAECTLDTSTRWQLLVSVRLAAQCTDARVNEIMPILLDRFPTVEALADAPVKIHSLNRAERQVAGEVGKKLAAPFSSEAWAERVMEMAKEIVGL